MDTKFQDAIIQGVGKRLVSIVQDAIQQPSSLPTGTEPAAELAGLSTVVSGECCAPGCSATSAEPDATVKSRVLKLGDGTLLHLADGDIPDPPAVSFVDDIPRLNGMWDDRCGELPIVGQIFLGIPMNPYVVLTISLHFPPFPL